MTIYFTSDSHFGHSNIIRLCNRPFASVDEMDSELVRRWNSVVGPNDTIYHLGDFAFRGKPARDYLARLNGTKHLIIGNHDNRPSTSDGWTTVSHYVEIYPKPKQKLVLFHYAMREWNASYHGSWHLYGHSHGNLPDDPNALSFDVGVDCWDFYPIDVPTIERTMQKKNVAPIVHHGSKK